MAPRHSIFVRNSVAVLNERSEKERLTLTKPPDMNKLSGLKKSTDLSLPYDLVYGAKPRGFIVKDSNYYKQLAENLNCSFK